MQEIKLTKKDKIECIFISILITLLIVVGEILHSLYIEAN